LMAFSDKAFEHLQSLATFSMSSAFVMVRDLPRL
jgi:hypothetical protein